MSTAHAGEADAVRETLVVGVGNEALRDEGVGLHALRALAQHALPAHVSLYEGGTDGLALVGRLEGVERLVLVDAMEMGRPPGTVLAVRRDEIRALRPADRTSLHGTGLLDALDLAEAVGLLPREVHIVGVQPEVVAWGLELSPAVQAALPQVVRTVLALALGGAPAPAISRQKLTAEG